MKSFLKENVLTLIVIFFSLSLYGVISYFSKPLATPADEGEKKVSIPLSIAKSFDVQGEAKSGVNNVIPLRYSLAFPSTVVRETKNDGREIVFYYDGMKVAVMNFIYVGKTGITPFRYVQDYLSKRSPLATDIRPVTIGKYEYITAGSQNSYFRVTSFKNGLWLGSFELVSDNPDFEKFLLEKLDIE